MQILVFDPVEFRGLLRIDGDLVRAAGVGDRRPRAGDGRGLFQDTSGGPGEDSGARAGARYGYGADVDREGAVGDETVVDGSAIDDR